MVTALIAGIALGIASQRIPQVRAYTDEVIQPIEHFSYSNHSQESPTAGLPVSSFYINHPGYSLGYDARNRNPSWVYEHLTAESIKGSTERSLTFKEDENIPKHLRATLTDYLGSGFDRGHQAPAADHRSSQEAMADTFFMTNMCPQCPQLNRGYWSVLEKHVRGLTKEHSNVYVITGPLYLPYNESDGKRYVKYQVIGPNDVAVPTHFFKIITIEDWQGKKATKAYILANQEISSNTPLDHFQTTIQKVEKAAGIIFNQQQQCL